MKEVTINRINATDIDSFKELIKIINATGGTRKVNATDKHLKRLLRNPSFFAVAAWDGSKIVGGLTGFELNLYSKETGEFYLYDIAVQKKLQRQGIGSQLFQYTCQMLGESDIDRIFVQEQLENRTGIEFYKKMMGNASAMAHFAMDIQV